MAECKELNVFMLRNWNLYDSCFFSNYLLAKLKTWTDDGVRDLEKLLVQAGIPLSEAKQKYPYMATKYKTDLVKRFTEVVSNKDLKYSLWEIQLDSFIKQIDSGTQCSAMDFVHSINAVLEHPTSFTSELRKETGFKGTDEQSDKQTLYDRIISREDNFWAVYHEILNEDSEYLHKAVETAIEYQTSIVRTGRLSLTSSQEDN